MCTGTSSTSSASTEMVADGETRRSKRVKVAPTRSYAPEVEEESLEVSPHATSGITTRNTELTAAVQHQQVPHEEMVLSSEEEESENDSDSSLLQPLEDTVQQQFQDEMVSSDEEIEHDSSSSSVHLDTIKQSSGNKRKRRAPIRSFDDRFNDLMVFKTKYGHCDVSQLGEDVSLGQWCSNLRGSYKKYQNNQKPTRTKPYYQMNRFSD
jgi:hypothetical protein